MKKALFLAVLGILSVCALAGCTPAHDDITPGLSAMPNTSGDDIPPDALWSAPIQTEAPPEEAFSLTVPYQVYPEDIENIAATVHVPAGETLYGALAPLLERYENGDWTALPGMGYCGTPDEIKDGALMPLPISSYEDIGPGQYRASLSVSENLSLDTDMRAYAYFELTVGSRVTADPRAYSANAGDLTLVVHNPSEGLVTLADTEIQIEMNDGGDWIGCGPAEALGSLALEQDEKGWISADLSGFDLPSGTYHAIVILSRNFNGEAISEVRMPEFQIK